MAQTTPPPHRLPTPSPPLSWTAQKTASKSWDGTNILREKEKTNVRPAVLRCVFIWLRALCFVTDTFTHWRKDRTGKNGLNKQPGDDVDCCGQTAAAESRKSQESGVINTWVRGLRGRKGEINGQLLDKQWSGRGGWSPPPTPPLPLKPLKYLSKEKKTYTLKPHHCPLLFSYSPPSSYLPLSLTPFLPQPSLSAPGFCCTNQEQMSAGAVLKDPAVLDASHMLFIQRWRLTARLLVKLI